MNLLKKMLEDAGAGATGGGAIAGGADSGATTTTASSVAGVRTRLGKKKKKKLKKKTSLLTLMVNEANSSFDIKDVLSKLSAAENHNEKTKDTQGFALEDEEGRVIKIYIKKDQAREFEQVLANQMDDEQTQKEIAEVLMDLRTQFNIVDVIWPSIPEDEEEVEGNIDGEGSLDSIKDTGKDGKEGDLDDLEGGEDSLEGEDDMDLEDDDSGEDDVKSTLTAVIDMMKADASARQAEAEAKKAEADKEASKYAAQAAEIKVKQEEETLDMEDHFTKQKDLDKEAKKLAKLAKYRKEKNQEANSMMKDTFESFKDARPVLNTSDIVDPTDSSIVLNAIKHTLRQAGFSRRMVKDSLQEFKGMKANQILNKAKSFMEINDPKDTENYLRNRLQADE